MRYWLVAMVLLSACSSTPAPRSGNWVGLGRWFTPESGVTVEEVGRAMDCRTETTDSALTQFATLAELRAWETARNLVLAPEPAPEAAYALVEMGRRNTGGYGIAVSRDAGKQGEALWLRATYVSPAPGRMVTQALTAPCVLVRLPQGYKRITLQDQDGQTRARTP